MTPTRGMGTARMRMHTPRMLAPSSSSSMQALVAGVLATLHDSYPVARVTAQQRLLVVSCHEDLARSLVQGLPCG